MNDSIKVGYYLVAFIDIVGQRDILRKMTSLPRDKNEEQYFITILQQSSEYVKELRRQFAEYYKSTSSNSSRLKGLPPERKKWYKERRSSITWYRGISDSYIITVPCFGDHRYGVHLDAVFSCLYGLAVLFLWALVKEKPFRGGIEIDLGTEISQQEVYGPVLLKSYELENKHFPCIFVGEGLTGHLDRLKTNCPNNIDGRHTQINIDNCSKLITTFKGNKMIDFMGEGVKSIPNAIVLPMIKDAYSYVLRAEEEFLKADNAHLKAYYEQLREYFEYRLPIWGLRAH